MCQKRCKMEFLDCCQTWLCQKLECNQDTTGNLKCTLHRRKWSRRCMLEAAVLAAGALRELSALFFSPMPGWTLEKLLLCPNWAWRESSGSIQYLFCKRAAQYAVFHWRFPVLCEFLLWVLVWRIFHYTFHEVKKTTIWGSSQCLKYTLDEFPFLSGALYFKIPPFTLEWLCFQWLCFVVFTLSTLR